MKHNLPDYIAFYGTLIAKFSLIIVIFGLNTFGLYIHGMTIINIINFYILTGFVVFQFSDSIKLIKWWKDRLDLLVRF